MAFLYRGVYVKALRPSQLRCSLAEENRVRKVVRGKLNTGLSGSGQEELVHFTQSLPQNAAINPGQNTWGSKRKILESKCLQENEGRTLEFKAL